MRNLLSPFPRNASSPVQTDLFPPQPITDMHCHAAGVGAGGSGCFVSNAMARSFKFGCYLRSFGVTRRELDEQGDGIIIERIAEQLSRSKSVNRAVVLALDGVVNEHGALDRENTEVYVPNHYVAKELSKHPNLLFGASVNPYRRDALERLAWAEKHGAVLVKWLPAIQNIDPADERLAPFYEKLAAFGLPLLTHTGPERSFTRADDAWSDPDRLQLPLRLGVTVIAAHAATGGCRYNGERAIDRLCRLMECYPRLYADISALTLVNRVHHLKEAITRPELRDRLLYGSDHPLTAMPVLVSPWYNALQLPRRNVSAIAALPNAWDRDVALKHALGTPADVWTRADSILRLPATVSPLSNYK